MLIGWVLTATTAPPAPRDAPRVRSLRSPQELKERFEVEAVPLRQRVYVGALRLTGNPADAEDLVQETYLRAYRGFAGFEPGTNLRGWLFRILRNVFITSYRKRQNEPITVSHDWYESSVRVLHSVAASAETTVLDAIPDRGLQTALASLPERYRRVVLLFDVDGFSYQEIADIVGIPRGTVMSRIHRGRRALRADLERAS
ncbi:RNA polymerase sigma-70 factor (ECF subfamily) [Kribbella kalugense]|uniref:RNA polymerase sigma-70 factor (ECF subfamily) n=1 Tax=Kribbella kalugense TaxID=2512221 RepID=A0A4R8A1L3_9ACTN|nr:RNA polymerase sigma-70 factor (ECF subfamily) [Kribbella kalugense]